VLSLVLCGAKLTSKGLVQRFGVLFGCQARIRCGFPVKKSISVRIRYRSGGLAVGSSGCGAVRVRWRCGVKQTSKDKQGLGALCCAVRVQGCGLISKQGLGAGFLSVR
jgi:hypothetical protein